MKSPQRDRIRIGDRTRRIAGQHFDVADRVLLLLLDRSETAEVRYGTRRHRMSPAFHGWRELPDRFEAEGGGFWAVWERGQRVEKAVCEILFRPRTESDNRNRYATTAARSKAGPGTPPTKRSREQHARAGRGNRIVPDWRDRRKIAREVRATRAGTTSDRAAQEIVACRCRAPHNPLGLRTPARVALTRDHVRNIVRQDCENRAG